MIINVTLFSQSDSTAGTSCDSQILLPALPASLCSEAILQLTRSLRSPKYITRLPNVLLSLMIFTTPITSLPSSLQSFFFNFLESITFIFLFYCCSSTVVSISLHYSTPTTTTAIPTSHPWSYTLWLCPCVLYTCYLTILPPFPPLSSHTSSLVTIGLFFISVSLVIFCLLICFVD